MLTFRMRNRVVIWLVFLLFGMTHSPSKAQDVTFPYAAPINTTAFEGSYRPRSLPTNDEEFKIQYGKNGRYTFIDPSGYETRLDRPDEKGRFYVSGGSNTFITFETSATGRIQGLTLHQQHECRRGRLPEEPEILVEDIQKYLGTYHDPQADVLVEVIFYENQLAVKTPLLSDPVDLRPPTESGLWFLRVSPGVAIRFNEDESGHVISFTAVTPSGDFERPRVESEQ